MSDKVRQEKIESVKCLKEAYEKAKREGLVTSRPLIHNDQGKLVIKENDTDL